MQVIALAHVKAPAIVSSHCTKEGQVLKMLCEAQLPLVAVRTRDVLNFTDVVKELVGKYPVAFAHNSVLEPHTLYYYVDRKDVKSDWVRLYTKLTQHESTLLVVNPVELVEPMFDGGDVPVPRSLMIKFMKEVVQNEKLAIELLSGFGGCTLKEASEFARLTMTRDASLTPKGVVKTRKEVFKGQKGLTLVDSSQALYLPPQPLQKWITTEKQFFLSATDDRLIPRGLLFDGPPGTGKSAGAKFVAEQFSVPLYRLDIGATKGKYVGQSEDALLSNLSRVDHEEPCVLLLDEVEKVFGEQSDGGTTASMMSQLLWWLAEHRSRVLTIMTTNNSKSLPPELYREGRVDRTFWFEGLHKSETPNFVTALFDTFDFQAQPQDIQKVVAKLFPAGSNTAVPQASAYGEVVRHIKAAATVTLTPPKLTAV